MSNLVPGIIANGGQWFMLPASAGSTGQALVMPSSGNVLSWSSITQVNGVSYPSGPSINTVPVVTGSNTVTYEQVPNAALVNSTVTISGHSIALGGSQNLVSSDVGLGNVTNNAQTQAAVVPNTAPSSGQVLVGNAGGTAYAPVTISGSGATITLSNTGVATISAIANASLSNSAITINGHSVSLGGSLSLTQGDVAFAFSQQSSNFTAAANTFYEVDISGGNVTATLSTAPANGFTVGFKVTKFTAGNSLTLQAGGSDVFNVSGGSSSSSISLLNQSRIISYDATHALWITQSGDTPVSAFAAGTGLTLTTNAGAISYAVNASQSISALSNLTSNGFVKTTGGTGALSIDTTAYAPLASPTFSGTPAGPTATAGTNTTQLATTAFVMGQGFLTSNAVSSVFGRTGAVVAASGDYSTNQVTENTNLYFTNARAIASTLTGYSSGSGTISSSDSVLSAIQKLNGNMACSAYAVFGNNTSSSAAVSAEQTMTLGTPGYTAAANTVAIQQTGSLNNYFQASWQNSSSGATASTDVVIANNLGTDTTYYVNIGMNSSGFSGSGSLNLPNAGYCTATNGDMVIGTTTANKIRFVTNSATTDAAQIDSSGNFYLPAFNTTGQILATTGTAGQLTTLSGAGAGLLTGTTLASNVVTSSLTTVGTIGTGTWQGSLIGATYGGTGVNNGSSTITIGGSVTFSGAYTFTGTLTAATSVTFPTSGTLISTAVESIVAETSNYQILASDLGHTFDVTSSGVTMTLPSASAVGAGWYCWIRSNAGITNPVTLAPYSGQAVDGLSTNTTYPMYWKEHRKFISNGTTFTSVLMRPGIVLFSTSGTFYLPPGVGAVIVDGWDSGGGGGGGYGGASGTRIGGSGAGGGAHWGPYVFQFSDIGSVGASVTVTVGASAAGGAGGASGGNNGQNGNLGNPSSFGSLAGGLGGGGAGAGGQTTAASYGGSGGGSAGPGKTGSGSAQSGGPPGNGTANWPTGGGGAPSGTTTNGMPGEHGGGSGGGGTSTTATNGGQSMYGGGGGASGGDNVNTSGRTGGSTGGITSTGYGGGGAGGAAGANNGTAGANGATLYLGGAGGGGGGFNASGTGGTGGAGGVPGGAGGGGGAGTTGGAGGASGKGQVLVRMM